MPKSRPPTFRRQMVELVRTGRTLEELAREWRFCCLAKVDSLNPPPRRSTTGSHRPTVTTVGGVMD